VTGSSSSRSAALKYWTIFEGAPEEGVALAPSDEEHHRYDFAGMNGEALTLRCYYARTSGCSRAGFRLALRREKKSDNNQGSLIFDDGQGLSR
jgi:hypothetical protein